MAMASSQRKVKSTRAARVAMNAAKVDSVCILGCSGAVGQEIGGTTATPVGNPKGLRLERLVDEA